jgi:hypothetical protein
MPCLLANPEAAATVRPHALTLRRPALANCPELHPIPVAGKERSPILARAALQVAVETRCGYRQPIGETGFEPATARPPAGLQHCPLCPGASPPSPASPLRGFEDTSDNASGTRLGTTAEELRVTPAGTVPHLEADLDLVGAWTDDVPRPDRAPHNPPAGPGSPARPHGRSPASSRVLSANCSCSDPESRKQTPWPASAGGGK